MSSKQPLLIFHQIEQPITQVKGKLISYLSIMPLLCPKISMQAPNCLLYKPNDRLISLMSHFTTSSLKHFPKQKYTVNIYQLQSQQKLFYPSWIYQRSPRQSKTALLSHKSLPFEETPKNTLSESLSKVVQAKDIKRNLFNETCEFNKEMKNPLAQQKQKVNFCIKKPIKSKISFSYKRTDSNLQTSVPILPQSCGNQKKEKIADKVCIEQFVLTGNKNFKQEKENNMKLHSKQLNYLILPHPSQKINKKNFFLKEKSSSSFKKLVNRQNYYNFNKKQHQSKIKESKIASTVATCSFQTQNDFSDVSQLMNEGANNSSYIKSIQILKSPFMDRLEPSKVLKETIIQYKYGFGGIVIQKFDSCKKQTTKQGYGQESKIWRSYVKCLFDENDNLKNSIHCGPDIRESEGKQQFLVGFGKQIKESCFYDDQS